MKKEIFNIFDPTGLRWIFQLRVGLSPLKAHKKLHNFRDTPTGTCLCDLDVETTQHFLLHCPKFHVKRQVLFGNINQILFVNDLNVMNESDLVHLLLYGNKKLKFYENQTILKATINYIRKTDRFSSHII